MNAGEIREQWEIFWAHTNEKTKAEKASQAALFELSRYYLSLTPAGKDAINDLLAEWVVSDDESKRFDALALIDEHRISSALPALHRLGEELDKSTDPGAPYERAKVDRIVAGLA